MSSFVLEGSPKTPTVNLNAEKGVLELKGRSIPENSIEFYKPIFDWVENYGSNPKSDTQVNVVLEYFNTSSSKCILDFFKKLENLNNGGKTKVTINWHYEEDDEDMLEAGEDYQAIISVPFKMVAIEEI
ncbi:MAG: DUF1987 domain-containing protein [Flavobacteriales bacterium]|nr:DUF1987 domain-containing protein [Flavobacteriales bacterium]